jgi:putative Holliday junction resolvase
MPVCKPGDLVRLLAPGARIIGLDFGSKTIGVAISDAALRVAAPVTTIRRTKFSADADELINLAESRGDRAASPPATSPRNC